MRALNLNSALLIVAGVLCFGYGNASSAAPLKGPAVAALAFEDRSGDPPAVDPGKPDTEPAPVAPVEPERGRNRRRTQTISYLDVPMPKVYSGAELREALRRALTPEELKMAVDPMADTEEMRRFAKELAAGAETDMEKAKAIFDGLMRRPQGDGEGGIRTAQEVFAAWSEPNESFNCQEYARLYIALARSVGVKSFYVHLERDYRNQVVYHDCAAVFAGGKALLVDPAYRWFGPSHKQYLLLDDVEAAAHLLYQPSANGDPVRRCRVAVKLDPDSAWGRVALVRALVDARKWGEARRELDTADRLEPNRWDAWSMRGLLARHEGRLDAAAEAYHKALAISPDDADLHHELAGILREQNKLRDAREHYRACLRSGPSRQVARDARRRIAEIDRRLGTE